MDELKWIWLSRYADVYLEDWYYPCDETLDDYYVSREKPYLVAHIVGKVLRQHCMDGRGPKYQGYCVNSMGQDGLPIVVQPRFDQTEINFFHTHRRVSKIEALLCAAATR